MKDGTLYGVLDIDSPSLARFDPEDAEGLSAFCAALMEKADWSHGLLG